MDPRKLMERLKGAAALTEQDVGEFSHFKGKMMKISVHSYAVEDWGSLSLLESRGMAGLMRRDMLVINSCVKDIPVLVIQYMGLFGRRMLQVHVLDVMKDKTAAGRFASLGKMAEQSGTAVQETPVEWYTPCSCPAASPSPARAVSWSSWPGTWPSAILPPPLRCARPAPWRAGICGCGSS